MKKPLKGVVRTKTGKACTCLKEVDEKLKPLNGRTEVMFGLTGATENRALVTTVQIQTGRGSKKPPRLMASYCPFCGNRYSSGKGSVDG